jgi:hypothetical protein
MAFFALITRFAWTVKSARKTCTITQKREMDTRERCGLDVGLDALYKMIPSSSREDNEKRLWTVIVFD